jgi:hypothetical protein
LKKVFKKHADTPSLPLRRINVLAPAKQAEEKLHHFSGLDLAVSRLPGRAQQWAAPQLPGWASPTGHAIADLLPQPFALRKPFSKF